MYNELQRSRHASYLLHVHFVFTPKYRKGVFKKKHIDFLNIVFQNTCEKLECKLIEFNGENNHVHLLVLYPPKVAISVLVNSLKGVSSRLLRKEFQDIKENYWNGRRLWSRSYFACSCGGASIDVLRKYIESQRTPKE
jgi:putative transposase